MTTHIIPPPKRFAVVVIDEQQQVESENGSSCYDDIETTIAEAATTDNEHLRSENNTCSEYQVFKSNKGCRFQNSSGIWRYFAIAAKRYPTPEEQNSRLSERLLCLICFNRNILQAYKRSTSSGNLWKHLQKMHGISTSKCRNIQETITFSAGSLNKAQEEAVFYDATNKMRGRKRKISDNTGAAETTASQIRTLDVTETDAATKTLAKDLIEAVSKRPALYEWSPTLTGRKFKRESLWQDVHKALNTTLPINRLQKMWKNIRDRYRKLKNNTNNGLNETSTKYKYYEDLRFLDGSDERTEEKCEAVVEDESGNQHVDYFELESAIESCLDESSEKKETKIENLKLYSEENECEVECETSYQDSDHLMPEEENPKCFDPAALTKNYENVLSIPVDCQRSRPANDEFDTFGQLVASKLRKIAKSRVSDVEINILRIFMNEE